MSWNAEKHRPSGDQRQQVTSFVCPRSVLSSLSVFSSSSFSSEKTGSVDQMKIFESTCETEARGKQPPPAVATYGSWGWKSIEYMEVTTEMSCLVCVLSTIMANPRDTKNLHCGRIECVRLRESVVSAKMPAPPTCTKIMQSKSIDLRFTTCAEVCIRQTALLPSPAQKRVDSPQRSLFHYGFSLSQFLSPFQFVIMCSTVWWKCMGFHCIEMEMASFHGSNVSPSYTQFGQLIRKDSTPTKGS